MVAAVSEEMFFPLYPSVNRGHSLICVDEACVHLDWLFPEEMTVSDIKIQLDVASIMNFSNDTLKVLPCHTLSALLT